MNINFSVRFLVFSIQRFFGGAQGAHGSKPSESSSNMGEDGFIVFWTQKGPILNQSMNAKSDCTDL